MDKIKCVITESGIIIPINNIVKISPKGCSHYVWTAIDVDCDGLRISDSQYNALLRELEYIGGKFIDYEKAYKDALETARIFKEHLIEINQKGFADEMEYIFPELQESEDEKIRKAIIKFLIDVNNGAYTKSELEIASWIAWLEKQGKQKPYGQRQECIDCQFNYAGECKGYCAMKRSEQKSANKVEPKFKVGDWVVWDNKVSCHVDNIYQGKESLVYTITDTNNMTRSYNVKGFEKNARLWNIADAKDGDVLVEDSCIFIVQKLDDNSTSAKTYFTLYDDGDFDNGSRLYFDIDSTKPATKEQRDLLFEKMKEAGYEWDAEKKEVRKIERKLL